MEVSGVVIHLWGRDVPGARCDCRLAVYALHVQVVSLQKAAIQASASPRNMTVGDANPRLPPGLQQHASCRHAGCKPTLSQHGAHATIGTLRSRVLSVDELVSAAEPGFERPSR